MTETPPLADPAALFGAIDIYLFDQLLKRRITPADRVLDVGCGWGRNLQYFLRAGYQVGGLDPDPQAIAQVRALAAALAPRLPADRFRVEPVEHTSFEAGWATVVVSSAVFHFARDVAHFDRMLDASWRCLAPGGLFFCRLASTVALETRLGPGAAGRRVPLPDGSERFVVDEGMLLERTHARGGQLLDPVKTTVVHGERSMTTWVVRKGAS